MSSEPKTWTVTAQNLPEHAGNAIHTDEGARAAGFESALVAGVTTYAYMTRPIVDAWGLDWVATGGGEVRFRAPVFAGDQVDCVPTPTEAGTLVEAVCPKQSKNPRAMFTAVRVSAEATDMRDGDRLPSRQIKLDGRFGPDYGSRAGEDLDLYQQQQIVHPAVWPALANSVMSAELARGAWIHTRSIIGHHAVGPVNATIDIHATVVERFQRGGERAVVDIVIEHDGQVLATLEHEAIVDLRGTS